MKSNNALIIGSGLSGSVIARQLAENGYNVVMLEERMHVGGNVYDSKIDDEMFIHIYGPHIFHTSNVDVWNYINRFTDWSPFELRTRVLIDNDFYNCPFNLSTIKKMDSSVTDNDIYKMIRDLGGKEQVSIRELLSSDSELAKKFGSFLWENDYKKYTSKQWIISTDDIDPTILDRVKINLNYYDKIHADKFEALPSNGYNDLIDNLLNHPFIHVYKGINGIDEVVKNLNNKELTIIYTGAIDRLFNYEFGELSYIGLNFKYKGSQMNKDYKQFDPCVDIYPDSRYEFTRLTDYGRMFNIENDDSIVAYEYPYLFSTLNNSMERYYPINTQSDKEKYNQYLSKAKQYKNLYLCGRLAEYKYYNMDEAIASALNIVEEILDGK